MYRNTLPVSDKSTLVRLSIEVTVDLSDWFMKMTDSTMKNVLGINYCLFVIDCVWINRIRKNQENIRKQSRVSMFVIIVQKQILEQMFVRSR